MNISLTSYQIKNVSITKGHGKNYMNDRPPLVRNPLRNCLLLLSCPVGSKSRQGLTDVDSVVSEMK